MTSPQLDCHRVPKKPYAFAFPGIQIEGPSITCYKAVSYHSVESAQYNPAINPAYVQFTQGYTWVGLNKY